MNQCEMTGCHDIAQFWVMFKYEPGIFEICESCADYWRKDEEYPATIRPYINQTTAAQL